MSTSRLNDRRLASAPEEFDGFPVLAKAGAETVWADTALVASGPAGVYDADFNRGGPAAATDRRMTADSSDNSMPALVDLGSAVGPDSVAARFAETAIAPGLGALGNPTPQAFAGTGGPSVAINHLVVRAGNEFLINSSTAGNLGDQQITKLPNGGFVITWRDESQGTGGADGDRSGSAIKMQMFTVTGLRIGTEILVNTATSGDQSSPKITSLSNGCFVITWVDGSRGIGGATGDGSYSAIKAQLFTATGTRVGTEVLVNTTTPDAQEDVRITALSGGGFVAAWSDHSGLGIVVKAQVFTASGIRVGSEILASSTTSSVQYRPEIAALSTGGFVVTSQYQGIEVQAFTSLGAKIGPADLIPGSSSQQTTALEDGEFVVTWINFENDVVAQIFSDSGSKIGSGFTVNTTTRFTQGSPVITTLLNGGFVVVWEDYAGQENYDIRAQVFTSTGTRVGSEILANSTTSGEQRYPRVIALENGGFVITWMDDTLSVPVPEHNYAGVLDVRAQVFTANGSKVGNEIPVNTETYSNQSDARAFALPNGGFVITWHDSSQMVRPEGAGQTSGTALRAQVFNVGLSATEQMALNLKNTGLSVTDPDAGDVLTVTLATDYGLLTVTAGTSGATVSGSDTATVTITGTATQIHALLSSDATSEVSFLAHTDTPPASALITLAANDGQGGTATTSMILPIQSTPDSGPARLIDLSSLTTSQGFVIQGDAPNDWTGWSVSGAGDVNGDGLDDLIVGAWQGDDGGPDAGEAYVIYGQAGTSRGRLDLSTLSASQGFVIQGGGAGDRAGFSVSSAGDVNSDGLYDLIVGADLGDDGGTEAGEAYVIYGQAGTSRGRLDLGFTLPASQGFVIQGDSAGDQAGYSVSSAGDVNGDGIDDLIVGAVGGDDGGDRAGEAYVIYGQVGTSRDRLDLSTLSASQGFVIQGFVDNDFVGWSVSSAGDFNGDGIDDLIVGSFNPFNDQVDGDAYVIYGQAGTSRGRLDLSTLSSSHGFVIQGNSLSDRAGSSVSSAGDVNGDGIDDLIVGVSEADVGAQDVGEAYVIYGQAGTSRGRLVLNSLSSSEGFVIQGISSGDRAGSGVSSAGDVNGDGIDDLIVGAPYASGGGEHAGEAYVIYGQVGSSRGRLDLRTLSANQGFVIRGDAAGDFAGFSVSSAGDVNGDGFDDLIVGGMYGDDGGFNAGEAYVIYGFGIDGPPILTGFGPSATFAENTVNTTPQLLDADVTFTDSDGDYDGGFLSLSGLLAEDRVSVRNEGSGAGQIGLSGANVTYGGVIIGTLAGGSGASLTITFNASATSAAIDALIQNLTYANASDTPTASRSLTINIMDSGGSGLLGPPTFVDRTETGNPFGSFDVGSYSTPVFADLDGDGDLDAIVGEDAGNLNYFENVGTASAPAFTERTGSANPLGAVDVGSFSAPALVDLDGDGDLDVVVGESDGTLNYFENVGSIGTPTFAQRTGPSNPFSGIDVGRYSTPTFADLDGDGDLDAVAGGQDGALRYFENIGSAGSAAFVPRTGAADPFRGATVFQQSAPSFADLDDDGDLDVVVGSYDGILNYFENTGTRSAPVFTLRGDAENPLNDRDVGFWSKPVFVDLDDDGDVDVVVGEFPGVLNFFENTSSRGRVIIVNVTTQEEGGSNTGTEASDTLTGSGGNDTVSGLGGDDVLEGAGGDDTLQGGSGNDRLIGGAGNDTIDGGEGQDVVAYTNAGGGVTVDLSLQQASDDGDGGADILLNIEDVGGSTFDDTIIGDDGANILLGGLGDDVLDGRGGLDRASYADRSAAVVATLNGATSITVTVGGVAEDTLVNIENLRGGSAADQLTGDGLANVLEGREGNDTLAGVAGNDTLFGQSGDDRLIGGLGNDVIDGGSGNDILNGGAGDDVLSGGGSIDTADYRDAASGVTVNLAITGRGQDTRGAGRDTLSSIENLTGSAFRDYFTGDAGDNVLSDTLGGSDRFIGGAGNDTLSIERSGNGAATDVTLTGGIGDDTMTFNGNGRYTDTVVFEGQDGNDVISATGAFKANVNGGAGNDTVTVDTLGGSFVVKLGSGSDTLILADTDGGFGGSAANLVRDFVAGNGGDIIDLTAYLAGGALTNYTPGDNPFLDGHMRLVQAGDDTLVQIDRDGESNGFVTVMTLQKTFASSFTAFNFNGLAPLPAPVEGGAGVDSLTGTSGIDVLNGNGGNDSLVGLAGADVLNGGAGNDVLDGGDGDDVLNGGSGGQGDTATYATASAGVNVNLGVLGLQNTGGSGFDSLTGIEHLVGSAFTDELRGDAAANQLTDTLGGNDFLRGEAGNDTLLITRSGGGAATTVRLNGGADNDALTFTGNGRFTDTVTLEGEAGNDVITVSGALTIGIDAGAGDDTIIYDTLGGVHRMTLGTGVDTVRLAGTGGLFQASGDNLVRDFATGVGGDIVDLSAYIAGGALTNYTGGDNPFGDGHMRLIQSGSRTLLQVDRDGGGDGYQTVLAFANTTVAAFTAANFNGIDPTGVAPMPVQASDKGDDAEPQVWLQETHDKTLMPEVLPGAGDEARDGFEGFGPLPGVSGGGADPWIPLTLDGAGDGFLTLAGGLDPTEGEPLVLPGEQADDLPELADLFTWTQVDGAGPSVLTVAEDGSILTGSGAGDHGRDGWLF